MTARRWTEDEAPARVDLRLAMPALALWLGALLGLAAGGATVAAVVGLLGLLLAGVACVRRGVWRPALVAILACFGGGVVVAGAAAARVDHDPLLAAARSGDWVVVDLTATTDATPRHDRFAAPDDPPRWQIAGSARAVTDRGVTRPSSVEVTVTAGGSDWDLVATGERLLVAGTATVDTFGVLDAVRVRAVGSPTIRAPAPGWLRWAASVRRGLHRASAGLTADRRGLLEGLVVGDTSDLPAALRDDARTTGLTHLVAVSGSHMAIVGGIALVALRRLGPRIAAGGAAMTLGAMVIVVGPGESVLRAVVMAAIGLFGIALGRERAALSALAAAVIILLLVDPSLAGSVGFTLSVQATAALILLAPPWVRALRARGVPRGWAELIVIPVAAHLATIPVIAAISGAVSLAAVPANIAVAPVVAPALLVGVLAAVVSPWWPAAGSALARLDGPLVGWIASVAHHLARWPGAALAWPATPAGVATLTVLLVAGLVALRSRRVRAAALAAALGVALVAVPASRASVGWPAAGWLITACDVGQGDGMVLATGRPGEAVVVDTGPEPDAIDGCLDRLGITRIPLLVITHLHADHVGGLAGALHGRTAAAIGVGPDRSAPAAWHALRTAAATRGIPLVELAPGGTFGAGALTLTVLGPAAPFYGTDSDPNNDSVVMMATVRGVRILMSGDIERPAQRALLASGADLTADVLKQPHHGSAALDPAFLAAVRPRVAVIGVGADNDYGHPTASALTLDRDAGVRAVLRTDRDGDGQVVLTGDGLATVARSRRHLAR